MLGNFASTNQFVLRLVFIIVPLDATRICMNWKPFSSLPLQNVWPQKIIGFIHMHNGPNKVGYIGLLQLLSDGSKLFWRHYLISLDRTTLKTELTDFVFARYGEVNGQFLRTITDEDEGTSTLTVWVLHSVLFLWQTVDNVNRA